MKIIEINPGVKAAVDENDGYCPCVVACFRTDDDKCMCKAFREQVEPGPCHCGRYEKVEEMPYVPRHPCYGMDKDFDDTCGLLEEG